MKAALEKQTSEYETESFALLLEAFCATLERRRAASNGSPTTQDLWSNPGCFNAGLVIRFCIGGEAGINSLSEMFPFDFGFCSQLTGTVPSNGPVLPLKLTRMGERIHLGSAWVH